MLETYSSAATSATHWLSGSPVVVGMINAVVTTAFVLAFVDLRKVHEFRRTYRPRFPTDEGGSPVG